MYVVDSADDMRLEESSKELNELLKEEQLLNVPCLVYANKQDIESAVDAEEITETLKLADIA